MAGGRSPGEAGGGQLWLTLGTQTRAAAILGHSNHVDAGAHSRGAPPPRAGPTQQCACPSARTPPPEQLTGWGMQPGPSVDRRPVDPRPAEPSSRAPASGPALQEAGCSLGPASPTRGRTPHMQQIPLPGMDSDKTLELKGTCTPMFIALVATGRTWGQAKCPSPDE